MKKTPASITSSPPSTPPLFTPKSVPSPFPCYISPIWPKVTITKIFKMVKFHSNIWKTFWKKLPLLATYQHLVVVNNLLSTIWHFVCCWHPYIVFINHLKLCCQRFNHYWDIIHCQLCVPRAWKQPRLHDFLN